MSYITKDQLNLYLQKVNGQSTGKGGTGTTRSRSTLTGPRPPTFKASSRKIFNNGPPSATLASPTTPTTAQLDSAVKNLSLSSIPNTPISPNPGPPSPILESMGETPGEETIMESMGCEDHEPVSNMYQHGHSAINFPQWSTPGYNAGPYMQHPAGYGNHAASSQYYRNQYDQNQQHHPVHLSQEQYLQLQQQQYQQQQQHAVSMGYQPLPTPSLSAHLQGPGSQIHPPTLTSTASKSITPRVIPIVDIPKYTIVNPPKTEIEDDEWTPEPPPRDPPKKNDIEQVARSLSGSHTPIKATQSPRPPTPEIVIPQNSVSDSSDSPRSRLSSHSNTPLSTAESTPTEEDRTPLPPPREFRRKEAPSPPPVTTNTVSARLNSNGEFTVSGPMSKFASSTLTNKKSTGISDLPGAPAPGTVRAKSEKFSALASGAGTRTGGVGMSNSKVATTTTANSWVTRKAIDTLGRTSPSSEHRVPTRDSIDLSMAEQSSSPLPVPPEMNVNKKLPPIRAETPPLPTDSPKILEHSPLHSQEDVEHESTYTLSNEDRAALTSIPLAADESKEILIEQEELIQPVLGKSSAPKKPARSSDKGTGSGQLSGFICSSCDEPISGMMITAMGKRWHSDHFVCTVCNLNLEHVQFFQKDGLPYCHLDYHDKFSPKCGHCNTAIENECLTALGKSWHPGHFFCRECGNPFDEDGYMVYEDFPYCEKDYLRLFAPKCTGCSDPIKGDFISALKGKWHRDCFGCTVCHIGFDSSSYYVENGKPYCQTHYKSGAQPTPTKTTV
ncbi:hypothetical protein BGZ51_008168 [Haplosporangium sp. Z 767]|nr:hypothetical protein BGZ50_008249 [Haplosporangium sp. Z 11]KAF9178048.1 hypothetical protein BGZ51_008168 [Haplosporangium sp. Z 767]